MKNSKLKKYILFLLTVIFLSASLTACSTDKLIYENETSIVLSDNDITVNGKKADSYGSVFVSNDVIYYEDKDTYESGNKYGLGTDDEKHTAEQAAETTVVNITKAGIYRLSGKLSNGQVRVNLGEDAKKDKSDVVYLVLDDLDINCDVAPAVLFMNVYECDRYRTKKNSKMHVDTTSAGANIIIADGSVNNVTGSHVAKIFKDRKIEKKLWKQDGAIYSYMSINILGEPENTGVLNVTSDKEGISSELHLTINGGNINITAQDDGLNVSEDYISAVTINGGNTHIIAGMCPVGGDGIDSNGWLVINGGALISAGYQSTDSGVDNVYGLYIHGGTLVSLGYTIDWTHHASTHTTFNLLFQNEFYTEDAVTITDSNGSVVFSYDPSEDDVVNKHLSNRRGIMIASPNFKVGETYNIYMGGEVEGEHYMGLYDISTVTGFKNARQQIHKSDERFDCWGMHVSPRTKYTPDTNFTLNNAVGYFYDVSDYIE